MLSDYSAIFDYAYDTSTALAKEADDWDAEYTLKELSSTLRDLREVTDPANTQRCLELGMRIQSLSALYISKLLVAAENAAEVSRS